jgi:D-alanyl-D-alanine carboxypeptidase/D-alanyl-D-alanine-endopeptidase (penicillin-binding protein 4)
LEGHKIVLEGRIPAYCGELDDYFSLLPHDEYFLAVFSALWQELGGTLKGKLREGTAPADSTPFAKYVSPPLSEVIRDINKFSNNIMARQLFLTLGTADTSKDKTLLFATQTSKRAEVQIPDEGNDNPDVFSIAQAPDAASLLAEQEGGDTSGGEFSAPSAPDIPSSVDDQMSAPAGNLPRVAPPPHDNPPSANITRSTAAMRQWLKTQQLQFPELVLENGAGLSRKERISAQHLAELLLHAARSRFSAELEASLPILGMDGSVKKRLKDSESAGYAHLKTGTLEGVKSLAGYVKAHSGKQWIVVFIVNHSNAALAQPAQDALVEWLQKEL